MRNSHWKTTQCSICFEDCLQPVLLESASSMMLLNDPLLAAYYSGEDGGAGGRVRMRKLNEGATPAPKIGVSKYQCFGVLRGWGFMVFSCDGET